MAAAPGGMLSFKRREPLSIGDFERLARRRLPRVLFETIESGVEDELCLATNREAFRRHRFVPRACADVAVRSQAMPLFGVEHSSPFGIAPTGIAGTFRRNAELFMARAAAAAGIPFILSGACMVSMEQVAAISPATTWFQLYPARDKAIVSAMVKQAEAAGIAALVLTIDNPVLPKRERDARNGFSLPLRLPLPMLLEALTHPAWIGRYWRDGGLPMMEIWRPHARPGADAGEVAQFFRSQSPTIQTWRDLERFRAMWPRKLVLKGVMHPDDAARAAGIGFDGVIVSNHGGKALDRVPAPLEMLPAVRRAVPSRVPVMLDSGVRRGSDIVARPLPWRRLRVCRPRNALRRGRQPGRPASSAPSPSCRTRSIAPWRWSAAPSSPGSAPNSSTSPLDQAGPASAPASLAAE